MITSMQWILISWYLYFKKYLHIQISCVLGILVIQMIISTCAGLPELIYWATKHLLSAYDKPSIEQTTEEQMSECCH